MKAISKEKALLISEIKEAVENLKKVKAGKVKANSARELLDEDLSLGEFESLKQGLEEMRLIEEGKLDAILAAQLWKE